MHDAHVSYDTVLVVLSYLVAVLGSFTALQLAVGIPGARTSAQRWGAVLASGAAVGVCGIWAMHFLAMLACDTGMSVAYDIPGTVASAVLAFAACSLGLGVAGTGQFGWPKLTGAGVCMGLGVAGMHYLGMSAMLMPATVSYNVGLVVASVAIAIVASIVALWLAFNLRGAMQMAGSALVMGVAVCGMHYTGMAAVNFHENGGVLPEGFEQGLQGGYLGMSIFSVVIVVLLAALVVNSVRRQRRAEVSI